MKGWPSWIYVDRGDRLRCARCGGAYRPAMPIPAPLLEALIDAWGEMHGCPELAPAVHVLDGGVAVCGTFDTRMPAEWPEGHRWVERDAGHLATCPGCMSSMGATK